MELVTVKEKPQRFGQRNEALLKVLAVPELRTRDLGGQASTSAFAEAVVAAME